MEDWTQTLEVGPLLGIAAGAIALILVLVIVFRVHAFLTLVLVSLATAIVAGIPIGQVANVLISGFGSTLGSVALLVGLGAMLGRLVEASGGARILADKMVDVFGEKRAPFALGIASLVMGFPIFFDAGLIVMLPIVFAVARRLGGKNMLLGNLIAFAIITESVCQWPGMGRMFLQSIQEVDLPVMSAYLLMISFLIVVLNLVVDILYYVVDPRLRVEGHGGGH